MKNQKEVRTHIGLMVFVGIICLAILAAYFYFMPTYRSTLSIIINPIDANNSNLVKSSANLKGAMELLNLSDYQAADGTSYSTLKSANKLNPKVLVKTTETDSIIKITVLDSNMQFAFDYVNAIAEHTQSYITKVTTTPQLGARGTIEAQIAENEEQLKKARAELAKVKKSDGTTTHQKSLDVMQDLITKYQQEKEPLATEIEELKTTIPSYFIVMAQKTQEITKAISDYKFQLKQYIQLSEVDDSTSTEMYESKVQAISDAILEMSASEELTKRLTNYVTLLAKSEIVNERLDYYTKASANVQTDMVSSQELETSVATYEAIIISLKQKLEETKIITNSAVVLTVENAELDDSYFTIDRIVAAVITFFFGMLVGAIIGLAKDLSNISITHDSTIHDTLGGNIDSLGWIPYENNYSSIQKVDSYASERYKILANNLLLMLSGSGAKVLSICSPNRAEGRTTTIVNLAKTLATLGKRILVVDADFKNPRTETVFGVAPAEFGLTDVVTGRATREQSITRPVEGLTNLNLLSAGKAMDSASIVFNSEPFTVLINEFKNNYDFIFIDCANNDFVLLSRMLDVYMVNVRAGITTIPHLREFNDQRRTINVPLIGYIFYGRILNNKASDSFYDVYKKATRGEHFPKKKNLAQAPLAYTLEQQEAAIAKAEQAKLEALAAKVRAINTATSTDDEKPIVL